MTRSQRVAVHVAYLACVGAGLWLAYPWLVRGEQLFAGFCLAAAFGAGSVVAVADLSVGLERFLRYVSRHEGE